MLSPKQSSLGTSIKHLYASDIETLCKEDEQSLHDFLQKSCSAQVTVALLPDATTMAWHHAREEFIALRLFDTRPEVKGALTHCGAQKTWCIWTHTFADDPSGNVLHLLRIAIPDNDGQITSDIEGSADRTTHAQDRDDKVAAIMRLLTAAQAEAVAWQMKAIHIWYVIPGVKWLLASLKGILASEASQTSISICLAILRCIQLRTIGSTYTIHCK